MRVLKGLFFAGLISWLLISCGGIVSAQRLTFALANTPAKTDSVLRYQSTGMQVLVTYQNNNQPLPVDTFFVIVKNAFGVVGRYYMLKAAEKNQAASLIRIGERGIYRIYVYNPKNRSLPVATGKVYITNDEFPTPLALLEQQRRLLISRGLIRETVVVNTKNKTPDNNVKTEKNIEPKPAEVAIKKTEPKKEEKAIVPAQITKTPVERPITRKPDSEPTKTVVAKPININKLPSNNNKIEKNNTGNATFGYTKTPVEKKTDNVNRNPVTEKKNDNVKIVNNIESDEEDTDSLLITEKLKSDDDDDDNDDDDNSDKTDTAAVSKKPVATVKTGSKTNNITKTQPKNKSKEDDFDDNLGPIESFDSDDGEFDMPDDSAENDDFDADLDDE